MITNQSFSGTEINKDAVSYVSFLDETSELFTSYQNQWNAKNDIKLLILCSFLRQVPGQAIKHSSSALRGEGALGLLQTMHWVQAVPQVDFSVLPSDYGPRKVAVLLFFFFYLFSKTGGVLYFLLKSILKSCTPLSTPCPLGSCCPPMLSSSVLPNRKGTSWC